jgi:hypothetical protein
MPKRSSTDINETAFAVVQQATQQGQQPSPEPPVRTLGRPKNPAAVMLGRLGGLKGGKARAEKLSKSRRVQIAKEAAKSRWMKK